MILLDLFNATQKLIDIMALRFICEYTKAFSMDKWKTPKKSTASEQFQNSIRKNVETDKYTDVRERH